MFMNFNIHKTRKMTLKNLSITFAFFNLIIINFFTNHHQTNGEIIMSKIRLCHKRMVSFLFIIAFLLSVGIAVTWFSYNTGTRDMRILLVIMFSLLAADLCGIIIFIRIVNPLICHLKREVKNRLQLSTAVEQSPESVIITDSNVQITYVNPAFCRITGYESQEVLGKNPGMVKSGNTSQKVYRDLWKTVLSGKTWRGELQNRKKNGTLFWEDTSIAPIFDDKGEITAFVAVKKDVTNQRENARALKYLTDHLEEVVKERTAELVIEKEKAEAANHAKSDFLAHMSHELRTPLHNIGGFSDLSLKKLNFATNELSTSGDSKAKECLKSLQKTSIWITRVMENKERQLNLINNLLDLAKLESGHVNFSMKSGDLMKIVQKEVAGLEPLFRAKEIRLNVSPSVINTVVPLDQEKISQVVINLLSNAIKFTPERKNITISSHQGEFNGSDALELKIKDEGCGIPPDELGIIFDEFVQSSTNHSQVEGSGLGLPICREIMFAHNGNISAENNPKGGAIFTIILPRKQEKT